MIKMEFSGTGEEVRNEMINLLGLNQPKTPEKPKVKAEEQQVAGTKPELARVRSARRKRRTAPQPSNTWTGEGVKELFDRISSNARKILAEIAQKPEGHKIKELAQALGIEEKSIKGQLSSVGKVLIKMGGKQSPISREKIDGDLTYRLDPAVADVLKHLSI